MTEISTNEPDVTKSLGTDQLYDEDDLEPDEKQHYQSLLLRLAQLQLNPKPETVSRIIDYSKSWKKSDR